MCPNLLATMSYNVVESGRLDGNLLSELESDCQGHCKGSSMVVARNGASG